jgi:hypothetical protein
MLHDEHGRGKGGEQRGQHLAERFQSTERGGHRDDIARARSADGMTPRGGLAGEEGAFRD